MNSIIDYFEKTVKSYPKKTALIYKDLTFTYQELHDIIMSKSMALNYLEKKSVVGIFMGNSSDFIISYLAVMKAGLIPHLIPLNLPTGKISDQIKNENIEKENAFKFAKKKKLLNDNLDYEKKLSKMARAGFSYDICKKILG